MARRGSQQAGPRLTHQSVRAHLVDYHFGRLSPAMNAAIEQHVRSCDKCRAEGLAHLATERRSAARLARGGYGGSASRPLRMIALMATLLLLALLIYLLFSSSGHGVHSSSGAFSIAL